MNRKQREKKRKNAENNRKVAKTVEYKKARQDKVDNQMQEHRDLMDSMGYDF